MLLRIIIRFLERLNQLHPGNVMVYELHLTLNKYRYLFNITTLMAMLHQLISAFLTKQRIKDMFSHTLIFRKLHY